MVDATMSMPLAINDIANTSKLKLLERLLLQSLGRLLAVRGIADGSKQLDVPAHKKAAVRLPALENGSEYICRSPRDVVAPDCSRPNSVPLTNSGAWLYESVTPAMWELSAQGQHEMMMRPAASTGK